MPDTIFIGGPIAGQKRNRPAGEMIYHVSMFNKRGRMMVAVYHRNDTGNYVFGYYIGQGREWRDD